MGCREVFNGEAFDFEIVWRHKYRTARKPPDICSAMEKITRVIPPQARTNGWSGDYDAVVGRG
jgi:hypothetical protein